MSGLVDEATDNTPVPKKPEVSNNILCWQDAIWSDAPSANKLPMSRIAAVKRVSSWRVARYESVVG